MHTIADRERDAGTITGLVRSQCGIRGVKVQRGEAIAERERIACIVSGRLRRRLKPSPHNDI